MGEKNFPLLRPYPSPSDLEIIRQCDLLFWDEISRLDHFTGLVFQTRKKTKQKEIVAQILREVFGARGSIERIYEELNQSLLEAQRFLRDLIKTYLPEQFRSVLESEGIIGEESDFLSLLRKRKQAHRQRARDRLVQIREYEARRLILLTLVFFELRTKSRWLHLDGYSLQSITRYLERKFFSGGIVKKMIISYHQGNNDFRVSRWNFRNDRKTESRRSNLSNKSLWKREIILECRPFKYQRKEYLVYFSVREKTIFSHFLKMLRKDIRDPYSSALDWRGFKLVFFSDEGLEAGLSKLREEVFCLPGVTWKLSDGWFDRCENNSFSSPNFRATKFITIFQGIPCEVIVETIENHLNGLFSTGDENHELYRIRQLIKNALPLLFPSEIYEIDWEEKSIQEKIISRAKAQIING